MRIACYVTAVAFQRMAVLLQPEVSSAILEELEFYRTNRQFQLCGYVVMPDHWHFVMICDEQEISPILRDMKSMIARLALDRLQNTADNSQLLEQLRRPKMSKRQHQFSLWQPGNWKVLMEDPSEVERRLMYIHANPVRAKLVVRPENWHLTSYRWYLSREPVGVTIDTEWAA
jgi:putative transposase